MKYSQQQIMGETRRFFQKVYAWMFFGLAISGVTAYIIANTPFLYEYILFNNVIFYTLLIVELILIIVLSLAHKKIPAKTAIFLFLLYCFMTGLTLSIIFLMFTIKSIALVFLIAAIMFGIMSVYGYFTKTDLTKLGRILMMGLVGIIIASLFNFSIKSTLTDYIISFIGVIVFTGLTAYDTQKIRKANIIGNENTTEDTKESVLGAINLYLDFMNLFLKLLRIFGKRR